MPILTTASSFYDHIDWHAHHPEKSTQKAESRGHHFCCSNRPKGRSAENLFAKFVPNSVNFLQFFFRPRDCSPPPPCTQRPPLIPRPCATPPPPHSVKRPTQSRGWDGMSSDNQLEAPAAGMIRPPVCRKLMQVYEPCCMIDDRMLTAHAIVFPMGPFSGQCGCQGLLFWSGRRFLAPSSIIHHLMQQPTGQTAFWYAWKQSRTPVKQH